MAQNDKAEDMIEDVAGAAQGDGRETVGDLIEALGHRGFGPLLFIFAMFELTPIGGVPGFPTMLAVILSLIAAQIVLGQNHLWLPDVLERRSVSDGALRKAVDALRPFGAWLDRWFGGRLEQLVRPVWQRIAAAVVIAHCATVPPLELIPFASSIPMLSIAMIGLAMTVRDGVLMLVALIWGGCALIIAPYLLIW